MNSMARCSLAARFLVHSKTEIGWDIASPLVGAPAGYGALSITDVQMIIAKILRNCSGFGLPTRRPPPWPRIDHNCTKPLSEQLRGVPFHGRTTREFSA